MTAAPKKGSKTPAASSGRAAKPKAPRGAGKAPSVPSRRAAKPKAARPPRKTASAPSKRTAKPAAPKRAPREAVKAEPAAHTPRPKAEAVVGSGSRVVDVLNMKKQKVGQVELSGRMFSTSPNAALIHEAVVMQQAAMRQGTADTKGRGEVSGTGRKPWKQKGTGRARAGSIRSPLWRGGGITFGPTPRGYGYAFPRKKGRAALAGALSAKLAQGELVVLDELSLVEAKTKAMVGVLKTLGLDGSVLIVSRDESGKLTRASNNLRRVTVLDVQGLNVYDVLAHRHIVLVQSDLKRLGEVWA